MVIEIVILKKLGIENVEKFHTLFPFAMIMLSLSLLLQRFAPEVGILAFFEGMLLGISTVILIIYIFLMGKINRQNKAEKS